MTVEIKEQDGKAFVTVNGELDTVASAEFKKELAPLMERPGLQVEIDMAGVGYIASMGLRVLLALAKSVQPGGGKVKVVNPTNSVHQVFDLSGFSTLFL
jgi:anti-anti-sigma factor